MMTFVIDLGLVTDTRRGMGVFILKISEGLSNIDFNYNLIFIYNKNCSIPIIDKLKENFNSKKNVSFTYSPFNHILTEQLFLPIYFLFNSKFKLISSGDSSPILMRKSKIILLLHDLYFFKGQLLYKKSSIPLKKKIGALYRRICIKRFIGSKGVSIITVSNFMKNDICDFMNVQKSNVEVVPNGIDIEDFQYDDNPSKKGLVLITGKDPQKNLKGFLYSLQLLPKSILSKLYSVTVVGVNYEDIKFDLPKFHIPLIFKGYMNHSSVKNILSKSSFFALPSFYESFGIPGLEALLFKCKVSASNTGALREVLGDCAFYFNPQNEKSIAKSITEMVKSKALNNTDVLKQISPYDWKKSSIKLNKFLNKI
ncbi:glycosyltransferase family 4 protein [Flavobacteriaceae bacterium]|nr:glycosyltransferase family 4 protein [Flavobacteriaceae bacterium]